MNALKDPKARKKKINKVLCAHLDLQDYSILLYDQISYQRTNILRYATENCRIKSRERCRERYHTLICTFWGRKYICVSSHYLKINIGVAVNYWEMLPQSNI